MVWPHFTNERIQNPKGFEDETKRKILNRKTEIKMETKVSKHVAEKEEHGRKLRRNLERSEADGPVHSRNV
jgi:primase-polymerase (primpol)-like protein